jgi:hypothetical protein
LREDNFSADSASDQINPTVVANEHDEHLFSSDDDMSDHLCESDEGGLLSVSSE